MWRPEAAGRIRGCPEDPEGVARAEPAEPVADPFPAEEATVKRAVYRLVSLTLVHTLVFGSVPMEVSAASGAQALAPAAQAPAPVSPPAVVNRSVPAVKAPPLRPTFSWWPSAAELTRARIFEEPLVPALATSRRENREL